jgi:choline dehydrogenase-like flavoprotein
LSKLLFLAGAKEIVLPVKELGPLTSLEQAKDSLSAIKASSLRGVSVHAMSGCKMGISPTNSIVDLNCRVWGQEAVYVVDSSVLPSSTGESPQGTIMALAHGFVDRLLGAE